MKSKVVVFLLSLVLALSTVYAFAQLPSNTQPAPPQPAPPATTSVRVATNVEVMGPFDDSDQPASSIAIQAVCDNGRQIWRRQVKVFNGATIDMVTPEMIQMARAIVIPNRGCNPNVEFESVGFAIVYPPKRATTKRTTQIMPSEALMVAPTVTTTATAAKATVTVTKPKPAPVAKAKAKAKKPAKGSGFATKKELAKLRSDMVKAGYATKAGVAAVYATKAELGEYATIADVNKAGFASKKDLTSFATKEDQTSGWWTILVGLLALFALAIALLPAFRKWRAEVEARRLEEEAVAAEARRLEAEAAEARRVEDEAETDLDAAAKRSARTRYGSWDPPLPGTPPAEPTP